MPSIPETLGGIVMFIIAAIVLIPVALIVVFNLIKFVFCFILDIGNLVSALVIFGIILLFFCLC